MSNPLSSTSSPVFIGIPGAYKDPAGNFSDYFADMDCDINDQLWKPEVFEGKEGLYSWDPPPPPSFLHPDDLADLMIGSHSASN